MSIHYIKNQPTDFTLITTYVLPTAIKNDPSLLNIHMEIKVVLFSQTSLTYLNYFFPCLFLKEKKSGTST
jgi:hypothetical protein